jgi:hypothetical protein
MVYPTSIKRENSTASLSVTFRVYQVGLRCVCRSRRLITRVISLSFYKFCWWLLQFNDPRDGYAISRGALRLSSWRAFLVCSFFLKESHVRVHDILIMVLVSSSFER